jgi:hypothetical protein
LISPVELISSLAKFKSPIVTSVSPSNTVSVPPLFRLVEPIVKLFVVTSPPATEKLSLLKLAIPFVPTLPTRVVSLGVTNPLTTVK